MSEIIPADGTEIITTTEEIPDSAVVSSTLASVASWSVDFVGTGEAPTNPKELVWTDEGDSILIEYVPSPDLFPLQYIDYLTPDRVRVRLDTVDAFDNLPPPEDAPEVVKMQEDHKDILIWNTEVTATGIGSDGMPDSASATLIIRVFANYNLSRDKLTEAVNARR